MKNLLKRNSRGELVRVLQNRLIELGYALAMDGHFGAATEDAIKKYQEANGLKVDGIVGPQTWQHIEEAFLAQDVPMNWDPPRNRNLAGALKKGHRGEFVRLMQQMLQSLGYLVDVDGYFGTGTDRIVRQFQRDNDLVIDGIIGANTLQLLSELFYYPSEDHPTPNNGRIDREYFFRRIRKKQLFHKLSTSQVAGLNYILEGWESSGLKDLRWLAYMLATVKHETANTMLPIEEYGKGKGRTYGQKIKMNRKKYTQPDHIYYGRGYVQLTWYENYEKMGDILGCNLLENPERALEPDIAMKVMIEGMTNGASKRGDFTGKKLENYFTNAREDWKNARRIINGTDKWRTIASYGKRFHESLKFA